MFQTIVALIVISNAAPQAHQHGVASLAVAVEGKTGQVEFEAPAEDVIGFERKPRNAAEEKKQADTLAKLKAGMAAVLGFPAAAGCTLSQPTAAVERHAGEHAEVHATWKLTCAKALAGGTLAVDFTKTIPLSLVKLTVLTDRGQTGAELKSGRGQVTLP